MPTLQTYRRTLAPLLGTFDYGTADSGANSTTTQLACTTALASGARFKSSVLSSSFFADKWIYLPSAVAAGDKDRLIDVYTPVSGFATVDDAWSTEPDGLVFELLSLFSGTELNALVNQALQQVYVLRDLTFTVTSQNVRKHQLNASATWLKSAAWVYQLGTLASGESWTGTASLPATDPYRRAQNGKAYDRAGAVWVEGPSWLPTDTAYALCACRAYDLCRASGGTYGDQSGLSLETDEAPVDAEWLAWVAITQAADRLEHLEREGQATQEAVRARRMAADRVTSLTRLWWQEPDRTLRPPPTYIGSSLGGRRRW